MSEEVTTQANVESTPANASGIDTSVVKEPAPQTNVEVTKEHDHVNERLLEDAKKYKAAWQEQKKQAAEWRKKVESIEQAKQEEQGEFKKLYENTKSRLEEKDQAFKNKILELEFFKAAKDAGCRDPEVALHIGDRGLLKFDEESYTLYGVQEYLEDLKKSRGYLFVNDKPANVNPAAPGSAPRQFAAEKPMTAAEIAKLPKDQKREVWMAAFKNKYGG